MTPDVWNRLDWIVARSNLTAAPFTCVGALGSEDRCVCVPKRLLSEPNGNVSLLTIVDPPSDYTERANEKIKLNRAEIAGDGHVRLAERPVQLFAADQVLVDELHRAISPDDRRRTIFLDISCLPKRFFFLYLKLLIADETIENVIVTYTQPGIGGYPSGHLSESPDEVRALPGFAPGPEPTALVVAVGFETLGLPLFLSEYRDTSRRIVLLVPFPPGQPHSQRTWQMLQKLGVNDLGADSRRISSLDAFDTLHALRSIDIAERAKAEGDVRVQLALAPYGPKPMSLGMAMYAIEADCPVFYTQPRIYHPDYTTGHGATWAYVVKLRKKVVFRR